MKPVTRRQILVASASGAAVLAASSILAGCTPAEEQSLLNDISTFCSELPPFTAIAVVVISSIPTIAAGATLAETVGEVASNVCTAILKDLTTIIENINNAGGVATVTVNSSANTAQQTRGISFARVTDAFRRHASKIAAKNPAHAREAVVSATPTSATIGPFVFKPQ